MTIETISEHNLRSLARLMFALWPDCSMDEELENCQTILTSEKEICYLVKGGDDYAAFIHLTIRVDYVEGADTSPAAYIEGMYVMDNYRHLGLGKKLIQAGEDWARKKGCRQLASDTEVDNAASIEFHKQNGFLEVNRVACFIKEL
jgi:aminoglycoside 6'-N-acetyltransferase I